MNFTSPAFVSASKHWGSRSRGPLRSPPFLCASSLLACLLLRRLHQGALVLSSLCHRFYSFIEALLQSACIPHVLFFTVTAIALSFIHSFPFLLSCSAPPPPPAPTSSCWYLSMLKFLSFKKPNKQTNSKLWPTYLSSYHNQICLRITQIVQRIPTYSTQISQMLAFYNICFL